MIRKSGYYEAKTLKDRKIRLSKMTLKKSIRHLRELLRAGVRFATWKKRPLPITLALLIKKR